MGSAMTCETRGGSGVGPAVIRYCLTYGLAIDLDPTQQPEAEAVAGAGERQHLKLVAARAAPAAPDVARDQGRDQTRVGVHVPDLVRPDNAGVVPPRLGNQRASD